MAVKYTKFDGVGSLDAKIQFAIEIVQERHFFCDLGLCYLQIA